MSNDTDAEKAAFYEKLTAFEGVSTGTQDGHDAVNQAMIRHWVEAMGDKLPIYTDADEAAKTVHGEVIAPPVMLQAWVMRGIAPRPSVGGSKQDELMTLLDEAGFSSVVATNCEQEYDRMLHLGDHLRTRSVIDSISEEKATGLGVGHFVTTRVEYETLEGEPVGRQLFRILKFKPGTGRGGPAAAPEEADTPRPKRPRPAITRDNAFWFEGAKQHRLLIQRCARCQVLRHPPRPRCDRCGSYEWDTVEASGRGTVYSFVVMHYPQVPAFDYPLPIGLVELEEGTRLVADLVGIDRADVKVGMAVTVEWDDHDEDLTLPAFRPA
ncbi:MAG TPA: bifunctional MaoC family dehydratase N-terminal/OB-fold nucleic acid binding domain-containing protein [Acidimicrobiia bacterium]